MMGGELAAGVSTRLFGILAEKASTRAYGHLRRILSMRRAVRDGKASDTAPRIEHELRRALGGEGSLTDAVSATLSDLAESGFLGHLALIAAADVQPVASKPLFRVLHARHDPDGDADRLFDKLFAALVEAFRITDPFGAAGIRDAKHEAVRQERALRERLVRVDEKNKLPLALHAWQQLDPDLFLPEDDMARVRRALSGERVLRCSQINIHDPRDGINPVPLDDVFVPLDLFDVERLGPAVARPSVGGRVFFESEKPVSHSAVLGVVDRIVVLGDPGGGKTTLVQKLCLDLARIATDGRSPVPIFVRLRAFDADRARGGSRDLIGFIVSDFHEAAPDLSIQDMRAALHHLMVFGRCMIVLDGLDEVLSIDRRGEVRDAVTRLAGRYPLCPIVVTSRIVGYDRAPLAGFPIYEVAPLSNSGVERLHGTLLTHVLNRTPEDAESDFPGFVEEAERAAQEFMGNPLLLSLIVILHAQLREIPDERARLYDACARLMYDRWDYHRSIDPKLPEKHSLFPLLARLAARLYTEPELGGRFSRRELERAVEAFFAEEYPQDGRGRARGLASAFMDHLTGRAWVLREVGQDQFEFTHRTFLEYFFAPFGGSARVRGGFDYGGATPSRRMECSGAPSATAQDAREARLIGQGSADPRR